MQFLPNFTEFAFGAPSPFANSLKGQMAVTKGNLLPFVNLHVVTANCMQRRSCFATPQGQLKVIFKS
jgi:hypothetical protein